MSASKIARLEDKLQKAQDEKMMAERLVHKAIKGLKDREVFLNIVESLLPRPKVTTKELNEGAINDIEYCPLVIEYDPDSEEGHLTLFDLVDEISGDMHEECREAIKEIWGKYQVKLRDRVDKELLVPSE